MPKEKTLSESSGEAPVQRPSIARSVHYVTDDGVHLAAIVTRIPLGPGTQSADLHVLPHRTYRGEWSAALNLGAIAYGAEMQPRTWHWPELE
ncbi:MAG TPA: hypothetical protein VK752_05245 [Bryobacteraceae bacterium]|jgi:hypothetical protein|nr:hypothetical protein [Bryobacteraceae bacterium]